MGYFCVAHSPDMNLHVFGDYGVCECRRFVLNTSVQKAIRALMADLNVDYTTALKEYSRRQTEHNF